MKKFKIVKKDNGKFTIKVRAFLCWWKIMKGSTEFDRVMQCVDYIYTKYNKEKCNIEYYPNW